MVGRRQQLVKLKKRCWVTKMYYHQIEVKGHSDNLSYLFVDKKARECLLIDPTGELRLIEETVSENNYIPKGIVTTHGHKDHIEGNDYFRQKYDVPIYAHRLATHKVDHYVDTGNNIEVGSLKLAVEHTPGHSPDHICLYSGEALFTGDLLFATGSTGRFDLEGSNFLQLCESIKSLVAFPEDTHILPGHNYGGYTAELGQILPLAITGLMSCIADVLGRDK